jgi:hypothetical protein
LERVFCYLEKYRQAGGESYGLVVGRELREGGGVVRKWQEVRRARFIRREVRVGQGRSCCRRAAVKFQV